MNMPPKRWYAALFDMDGRELTVQGYARVAVRQADGSVLFPPAPCFWGEVGELRIVTEASGGLGETLYILKCNPPMVVQRGTKLSWSNRWPWSNPPPEATGRTQVKGYTREAARQASTGWAAVRRIVVTCSNGPATEGPFVPLAAPLALSSSITPSFAPESEGDALAAAAPLSSPCDEPCVGTRKNVIVNLTPHPVVLTTDNGDIALPSTGIARCEERREVVSSVSVEAGDIDIEEVTYGDITGLPAPVVGTIYVVSQLVLAASDRHDLVCPGRTIRDANGRVTSCTTLSRRVRSIT
jgi:hypothetical protein